MRPSVRSLSTGLFCWTLALGLGGCALFEPRSGTHHEVEAGLKALARRGFVAARGEKGNGRLLYAVPIELGGTQYSFSIWQGQQLPDRLIAFDTETARSRGAKSHRWRWLPSTAMPAAATTSPRSIYRSSSASTPRRTTSATTSLSTSG